MSDAMSVDEELARLRYAADTSPDRGVRLLALTAQLSVILDSMVGPEWEGPTPTRLAVAEAGPPPERADYGPVREWLRAYDLWDAMVRDATLNSAERLARGTP